MKKFSEFDNQRDVYKLSPDYDDHIIMTRDITLFDDSPFKIDSPPANDSDETRAEIMEIADRVEYASSEDRHKAQEFDIRYSDEFIGYCIHHNLPVTQQKIMRMVHEMSAMDRKVKYHFNRPRPRQMANILGVSFPQNAFAVTSDTPSYPSGHSAGSHTLALYLSNLFPSHKQEFLNMAEECGMSRITLGVHFPSDHEAGVSLGEQFYKRLKDKT